MTDLRKGFCTARAAKHVAHGPESSLTSPEVVVELADTRRPDALRELRSRLTLVLDRGPGTVIVDLSEMTQLSSATVAALLWIRRRCRSRNVIVVLRKPSRGSIQVLRRTGLQGALPVEQPDAKRAPLGGAASPARRRDR